jgi:hypothetical protein
VLQRVCRVATGVPCCTRCAVLHLRFACDERLIARMFADPESAAPHTACGTSRMHARRAAPRRAVDRCVPCTGCGRRSRLRRGRCVARDEDDRRRRRQARSLARERHAAGCPLDWWCACAQASAGADGKARQRPATYLEARVGSCGHYSVSRWVARRLLSMSSVASRVHMCWLTANANANAARTRAGGRSQFDLSYRLAFVGSVHEGHVPAERAARLGSAGEDAVLGASVQRPLRKRRKSASERRAR